jgi:hypothetical protein
MKQKLKCGKGWDSSRIRPGYLREILKGESKELIVMAGSIHQGACLKRIPLQ